MIHDNEAARMPRRGGGGRPEPHGRRMSRLASYGLVSIVALSLTACGSSKSEEAGVATAERAPDGAAAKPASDQDKLHEFGQCMRENGIDMPDPKSRDDLGIPTNAPRDLRMRMILGQCMDLLPAAEPVRADPVEMAKQRKFAKCLRAHGLPEVPDPEPALGAIAFPPSVEFGSEKYRKAAKACGVPDSELPAPGSTPAG